MHNYRMFRNFILVLDVLEWILICNIQVYRKMYTYSWHNHIFKEYNTVVLWDMPILTTQLLCSLYSLIFILFPSFLNPKKLTLNFKVTCQCPAFSFPSSQILNSIHLLALKNSTNWLTSGTIINILHNSHIRYQDYIPPSKKIITIQK
jgi:hypothetical protein